jgi:hypothetical protein
MHKLMIFRLLRTTLMLLGFLQLSDSSFSQNSIKLKRKKGDYSGTWAYEVKDTPYGNYSGKIILTKNQKIYKGEAINQSGVKFAFDFVEKKGDILIFRTNLEETNSMVYCKFKGDSLRANVKVQGDDFAYKLKGGRQSEK